MSFLFDFFVISNIDKKVSFERIITEEIIDIEIFNSHVFYQLPF